MELDRYIRITLRIPRELHARLDAEADRTSKSLNAEIVARLEESFQAPADAMKSAGRETQLLALGIQTQGEMLDLRAELIRMRREGQQRQLQGLTQDDKRSSLHSEEIQRLRDQIDNLDADLAVVQLQRAEVDIQARTLMGAMQRFKSGVQGILKS